MAGKRRIDLGLEDMVRIVADRLHRDRQNEAEYMPFAEACGKKRLEVLAGGLAAARHHDAREYG